MSIPELIEELGNLEKLETSVKTMKDRIKAIYLNPVTSTSDMDVLLEELDRLEKMQGYLTTLRDKLLRAFENIDTKELTPDQKQNLVLCLNKLRTKPK